MNRNANINKHKKSDQNFTHAKKQWYIAHTEVQPKDVCFDDGALKSLNFRI